VKAIVLQFNAIGKPESLVLSKTRTPLNSKAHMSLIDFSLSKYLKVDGSPFHFAFDVLHPV
jgi:hypothetical protein